MSHKHRKQGQSYNSRGGANYTNRGNVSSHGSFNSNNQSQHNQNTSRVLNLDIEVNGFPPNCTKNEVRDFLRRLIKNLDCNISTRNGALYVLVRAALKNVVSIIQTINNATFSNCKLFGKPVIENPFNDKDQEARLCVQHGYKPDQKVLNLSQVFKNPEFRQKQFMNFLARSVVMYGLEIETFLVADNDLTGKDLRLLQPLFEALPNIANMSLSGNQITDLEDLIFCLRPMQSNLKHIILQGNPLVAVDSAHLQLFHDHIGRAFPNLVTLDQIAVTKLIRFSLSPNLSNLAAMPLSQGGYISPGSQPVLDLMLQFFKAFDARDPNLVKLYTPTSSISVTTPKDVREGDYPTSALYLRMSQNLEKSSRNKAKPGAPMQSPPPFTSQSLLSFLTPFPRTHHPAKSFNFDIVSLNELQCWHVNVSGFYLEWEPVANHYRGGRNAPQEETIRKRDFYRSFVITSNGLISSDVLLITSNAPKLSDDEVQAAMGNTDDLSQHGQPGSALPPIPPQYQSTLTPEQAAMVQNLAANTQISFESAMQALTYTKGDINQAMQAINTAKANGTL